MPRVHRAEGGMSIPPLQPLLARVVSTSRTTQATARKLLDP
jgi:hypothetical protein